MNQYGLFKGRMPLLETSYLLNNLEFGGPVLFRALQLACMSRLPIVDAPYFAVLSEINLHIHTDDVGDFFQP